MAQLCNVHPLSRPQVRHFALRLALGIGHSPMHAVLIRAGIVTVAVTNDGQRWSSGLDIDLQLVRWPSNTTDVPLDYDSALAPPRLSIGASRVLGGVWT